jgi:hypothetical protein
VIEQADEESATTMARCAQVIICVNIEACSKNVVERPPSTASPLAMMIAVSTLIFPDLNPRKPTVEPNLML